MPIKLSRFKDARDRKPIKTLVDVITHDILISLAI